MRGCDREGARGPRPRGRRHPLFPLRERAGRGGPTTGVSTLRSFPCTIAIAAVTPSPRSQTACAAADPASITAGALTVARFDREAYLQPAPGLNHTQMISFQMGRHHFDKKWASLSSLQFEWGLGPTFLAKSCDECHTAGGRGRPPQSADEPLHSMLVRISIPGEDAHGGPNPDPSYGDQFQTMGLSGPFPDFAYHTAPVPPEAALYLDWEESSVTFADGEAVTLRRPKLRIENLAYGPLGEGAMTSLRNTQPLVGLGLLEAVPEDTLLAIAKEQRTQGINGRPNYVRDDFNDRTALGRFGWKANQPSIRQQVAAASLGDMGLTTRVYRAAELPASAAPVRYPNSRQRPRGRFHRPGRTGAVDPCARGPGTPQRGDPDVMRGQKLFEEASAPCATSRPCAPPRGFPCRNSPTRPSTPTPICCCTTWAKAWPMAVPTSRPAGATGALSRCGAWACRRPSTATLPCCTYGRARNITEAILWHGGEAEASREAFRSMPKADREALVKFLESI